MAQSGSVTEMLAAGTDMLVWMIVGWEGIETATDPPKQIPYSEKNLKDLLDFDQSFKETLIEKTGILDHMTGIRVGYARKVDAEKRNLFAFTRLTWMLRRQRDGAEVHAVMIDGKPVNRNLIRLMPANFEAVRILGMMNTLEADFFTALDEYERFYGTRYDVDMRYVLQEKISYIKNLMGQFDSEAAGRN